MRIIALILITSCFSCSSQEIKKSVNDDFYLKSHELLDDIFDKGTLTYALKKNFDFNDNLSLTDSKLFDEIYSFDYKYFKEKHKIDVTKNDFIRFKDTSGWVTGLKGGNQKEWDENLFIESKVTFVDVHQKKYLYSLDGINYINCIPLNINFKEDLAMVEYKGAFGLELRVYKFIASKWYTIGGADEYKNSPE
jgi:hypothetical protein